jgi:hypothetical protein
LKSTNALYNGAMAKKVKTPARVILCAGVKSSGSTWLFNVVIRILKEAGAKPAAFYADNLTMFPEGAAKASHLVIKTHEPSKALLLMAELGRGPVFLTIRDPRDAVASLMLRFGHSFEGALKDVAGEAARVVELSRALEMPTFRYEDGFFDKQATVARIAALLGVKLSKAAALRIHRALLRENVARDIEKLKARGRFGADANPDNFDPATHWHPGHVGDGRIGKFESVLTREQRLQVARRTREYSHRYGYALSGRAAGSATPPPSRRRPSPPRPRSHKKRPRRR